MADALAGPPRRLALLVNPVAGGGRALRRLPRIEAALRRRGVAYRTERTRSLAHARELAATAAAAGEVAVALGGDGVVGAVAAALAGRADAVMGVLPGGRGNDFARCCGLPRDPVAAATVLATGVPRAIDVGAVAGRVFVGIASVGFDSEANRHANAASARLGALVYAYGALRALAGWRPVTFDVAVDEDRRRFTGWTVAAANATSYGGGMLLAPQARLDDGRLDVVLVAPTSRRAFVRDLPRVFTGRHVELDAITMLRGREVHIAADRPLAVYADGDPIAELPTTIRALGGAVQVLLPA